MGLWPLGAEQTPVIKDTHDGQNFMKSMVTQRT